MKKLRKVRKENKCRLSVADLVEIMEMRMSNESLRSEMRAEIQAAIQEERAERRESEMRMLSESQRAALELHRAELRAERRESALQIVGVILGASSLVLTAINMTPLMPC